MAAIFTPLFEKVSKGILDLAKFLAKYGTYIQNFGLYYFWNLNGLHKVWLN